MKKGNQLVTDVYVKPTDKDTYMLLRVTFLVVKSQCLSVKPCVLTEFVLKTLFLINDVMNYRYV